jgi:hypothetical protein
MSLATNAADLVTVSVAGAVAHPGFPGLPAEPYRLAADGTAFLLPTHGGIVHNVSVGDRAFGWAADCVHPGVSIRQADDAKNRGLNVFACVGNPAMVVSGGAAGETGTVTGKSGRFSEQVIVHFPVEARRRMAVGDRIVVRARGVGLALPGHPGVTAKGLAPELLARLPMRTGNRLEIGVAGRVPAHLIGAGLGLTSEGGSLHMQSTDREALAAAGLDRLRIGDLVAIEDTDSRFNHGYLRGALSVGVICTTDGPRAGYGPGMAVVLTAPDGALGAYAEAGANVADILGLQA